MKQNRCEQFLNPFARCLLFGFVWSILTLAAGYSDDGDAASDGRANTDADTDADTDSDSDNGVAELFQSVRDGNWSAPDTWDPPGVPGPMDRVVIIHSVTMDRTITLGHSPESDAAEPAVLITSEGTLELAQNRTLISRGDIRLAPGYLTLQPGAAVELDASAAVSPGSTVYKIDINPDSGSNNALLQINGTAQNRCAVRSNSQGGHGRITDGNGAANGGRMIAQYCDFSRLGGHPDYSAWTYQPTAAGDLFRVSDSTFDGCSGIQGARLEAGARWELHRNIWRNSVVKPLDEQGQWEEWHLIKTGANPGALGELTQCDFDQRVYLSSPEDYIVEDNVFRRGIHGYPHFDHGGIWRSFARNVVVWYEGGMEWGIKYGNLVENNLFIKDIKGNNPHFMGISKGRGRTELRNNIVWYTGVQDNAEGDTWIIGCPESGDQPLNQVVLEGNLYLPGGQGPEGRNNISGTGFTMLSECEVGLQVDFRRNTVFVGAETGGCNVGETNAPKVNDIGYFKSNLFVGTLHDGQPVGEKLDNLGHSPTDVIYAVNADYNAGYRLIDGTCYGNGSGKGYNRLAFSGNSIIGEHDIDDVDPQFVDPYRTPLTWDADNGGPGTLASALDRLEPSGTRPVTDLLDYLREGFKPQNPLLKGAGDPDDGSPDIGAVALD